MTAATFTPNRTDSIPVDSRPRTDTDGNNSSNGDTWNVARFAAGVLGLGALILTTFAVPLAMTAALAGQASVLWVCIPHMALASVILGGILAAMFLMDSPDDRPAPPKTGR